MKIHYFLFALTVSLAAQKPVGLEWRDNCCSYAAVIQLLYGLDLFRDFVLTNKSLIESRAPGTTLAALLGIFSRIKQAEDAGQEMVPYEDLKSFYTKLGLTGQFVDAFGDVLLPLLEKIDEELRTYLQELWREFKKLWIVEFVYPEIFPQYRPIFPISWQEVADDVADNKLKAIRFPRYQAVYGGLENARDPVALSISPYGQFHSIDQLTVVPRGSYELVGAFRVMSGHVTAIRSDGLWYFCDGKTVREISRDALRSDYQTLSWRFYAHEPLIENLEDFSGAFAQLLSVLP